MSEEKRRESAGRLASAIALPEWSLRRKLALALTIPMLLAATFGGLRVHVRAVRVRQLLGDRQAGHRAPPGRRLPRRRRARDHHLPPEARPSTTRAGSRPSRRSTWPATRLEDIGEQADLTAAQRKQLDSVLTLSEQLRDGRAYVSAGSAVSQVRQLQRGVTQLIDSIVAEQLEPEPSCAALQQAMDGRVSLAMQQYMVNVRRPEAINLVDLSAELGVEQVIIDRLGSIVGTTDPQVQLLNQQNAAHFGVVRGGGHDLGDAEAFEPYDDLSVDAARRHRHTTSPTPPATRAALAIANAMVTMALLLAAIFLALLVSRMLLNPIRRVREGALEVANTRLPEMVAKIRAGERPGRDHPDPRAHPRGDGPAGPRGRRPAPAGRAPGVRRGQAALAGRRDVLDPVAPQHLADQPAARPDRAAGEGRGGPEPPRVACSGSTTSPRACAVRATP